MQEIARLDPKAAARRLIEAQSGDDWLDEFAAQLDRQRNADTLARILAVWDLNQSDAARIFDVSRQAISKWMNQGVPPDRAEAVATLAAATDLLVTYLKRERIPAVVRRSARALGDRSLLALVEGRDFRAALEACRDMFAFGEARD